MNDKQMNKQPDYDLVTIGITCYNAQDTIKRAIDSALKQDWSNTEIIIVDDASSDQSCGVVNEIINHNDKIRLIVHEKNTGPAGARNTILENAAGEFVAFFDDDDESFPNRLSKQIEILKNYEERHETDLVACYAGGERHYENGYIQHLPAIGSRGPAVHGPSVANYLLFFEKQKDWFYGSGTPTSSLLARKSIFEAVGLFDASLRRVEDVDLAIRWALNGGHFTGTNEKLFIRHASEAADKTAKKNHEAEQHLAVKNETYLRSINRYDYAYHWPTLRYAHFTRNYGLLFKTLIRLVLRYPIQVPLHFMNTASKRLLHEFFKK